MTAPALLPRLQLLAAAFLFSTGGMAVKSCGLPDAQIAGLRCGIAAVLFLLVLPAARRWPSPRVLAVGAAYAGTLTFYVLANKATAAVNAIFLQATAPLYIVLLGPWLLGERSRRRDFALLPLMGLGLALLLSGDVTATDVARDPARGNLFGWLSGVCWAATLMGLRYLELRGGEGENAVTAVVAGNGIAFFASLPLAWPFIGGSTVDWLWLAYLGIFQVGVAYLLLTRGMRSVPAFEASLLLLVEPVFNPFWAYLTHGEVPGRITLFGAGLVLLAMTLKPFLDHRLRSGGRDNSPEARRAADPAA